MPKLVIDPALLNDPLASDPRLLRPDIKAALAIMAVRAKRERAEVATPIVPIDWTPLQGRDGFPSPQQQGYESPADILFFGGAGGGGKSDLLLGLSGKAHRKSIIFRREFPQTAELRDRSRVLCGAYGRFNGQEQVWHLNDGRIIEFGAVQIERFVEKYQGRPHDLICVGRGTPVRMGNGTYKPIEQIVPGDLVATLEGPHRVTRVLPLRRHAVSLNFWQHGSVIAQQVQSANHEILTTNGWVSFLQVVLDQDVSCEPTQSPLEYRWRAQYAKGYQSTALTRQTQSWAAMHTLSPEQLSQACRSSWVPSDDRCLAVSCLSNEYGDTGKCDEWSLARYGASFPYRALTLLDLSRLLVRWLSSQDHRFDEGWCVGMDVSAQEIDFSGSVGQHSETEQPLLWIDPVRHLEPFHRLWGHEWHTCAFAYGAVDEPPWSSRLGYLDDYLSYIHHHDGHALHQKVVALLCPQLLNGVVRQTPMDSGNDDQGKTPRYSLHEYEYPHPYTKEIRSTADLLLPCEVTFDPLGEMELFDLTVESVNHYITGEAGIVNKNCFDEVAHFLENQFRFLNGWLRTTTPGQRCRVVATGNPPTSAEGEWIIQYWGPWLDPQHPYPAIPGELRWYATVDGKDQERQDGTPFEYKGEILTPMSRTFIPSRVEDNPYLMASGYKTVLQNLPEPLRSKMLHGDFSAGLEDNPWQVIPTAWVDAAMARWTEQPPDLPLSALGVDVARGGHDQTTIAKRYGPWFAPIQKYPGIQTPDGPSVAALVILAHTGDAPINIDIIGVGGSGYDYVKGVKPHCTVPMNGAKTSTARDRSGQLHFRNKRAEWHWMLREALDPVNGEALALPPDREMRADLIAPRWKLSAQGIQIEEKDDIKVRLGRSPDSGEAVIYAHAQERARWLPIGT